jgi:ATP/maltotriose-dependent transcriptional regulator MalT
MLGRMGNADPRSDARDHMSGRKWEQAFAAFEAAEAAEPLTAADVELWAETAYLLARDEACLELLELAHKRYAEIGDVSSAVRLAFWKGLTLMFRGEAGQAMGWFGRAQRMLDDHGEDCVALGYLMLARFEQQLAQGECEQALETARQATEIGKRFEDKDLTACGLHLQGRALLVMGHTDDGLALFDETMVCVLSDELGPRVTGMIYCSVIQGCQLAFAYDRSREWTAALSRWCDSQPSLLAFTGTCMVHRAEVLQLSGHWADAVDEVERACERFERANSAGSRGPALYVKAEIHRLRGDTTAAEETFREAGECGCDPQPGLALLRLRQGKPELAAAAMKRALSSTPHNLRRSVLLRAAVEISLALDDVEMAKEHTEELQERAAAFDSDVLLAMANEAQARLALHAQDGASASRHLGRALEIWRAVGAPFEEANTRALMGDACELMGDEDGASMERHGARALFDELGIPVAEEPPGRSKPSSHHGLTGRELEVLALVASGKTNRNIGESLGLSVKTIDRHVSNIFDKLGVSSRAEATAYAVKNDLA